MLQLHSDSTCASQSFRLWFGIAQAVFARLPKNLPANHRAYGATVLLPNGDGLFYSQQKAYSIDLEWFDRALENPKPSTNRLALQMAAKSSSMPGASQRFHRRPEEHRVLYRCPPYWVSHDQWLCCNRLRWVYRFALRWQRHWQRR